MATQRVSGTEKPTVETGAAKPDKQLSAGGNPAFDERRAPEGQKPRRGRQYAGGNPWFDEREAPKK